MSLDVFEKFGFFIASAKRVFVIAKKPNFNEFQTMAKVTGLGILIISVIAYIIFIIFAFSGLATA